VYLFAYVFLAPIFGEGRSHEEAYRLGRLPWIAIAEIVIVIGGTAAAAAGLATVVVAGGWLRRAFVIGAAAPVALWWFAAMIPVVGAPCGGCPPATPDPFAYAYSLPDVAMLLLIAPAAFIAAIALLSGLPAGEEPAVPDRSRMTV
jgi:hypothetical protein